MSRVTRTCTVSGGTRTDQECQAPAGHGGTGGWAPGDEAARLTCWDCEEPVCEPCSALVLIWSRYCRMCENCLRERVKMHGPLPLHGTDRSVDANEHGWIVEVPRA